MADFASLIEVKAALDVTDTSADVALSLVNKAATQLLIDYMNRDPRLDTFVFVANGLGSADIIVPEYPIIQVFEVRLIYPVDTLIDPSLVAWSDNLIFLRNTIVPRVRNNVRVVYSAGLDPLPKTLSLAAIYTVRALLASRKVDLNSTGESWQGVSSQTWTGNGPGVVPIAAQTLLQNFVRRA